MYKERNAINRDLIIINQSSYLRFGFRIVQTLCFEITEIQRAKLFYRKYDSFFRISEKASHIAILFIPRVIVILDRLYRVRKIKIRGIISRNSLAMFLTSYIERIIPRSHYFL